LGRSDDFGSLTVTGALNYVRGENRSTGDNLYHMMPRNKKFALVHRLSSWTTTAEVQRVDDKTYVSRVRNETPTAAYSLFNLRASYELKYARIDIGVENVFNRFYELPLGGAYTGQGDTMMTNNIPWGVNIPGMGRSINAALNMHF
jgi:iron complex outermembrane receptor protein